MILNGKLTVGKEEGRKNVFNISPSVPKIGKVAGVTFVQIFAGRRKSVAQYLAKALVGLQNLVLSQPDGLGLGDRIAMVLG